MKRYLVIGNPIDHSFSPKLHNYWMGIKSINGIYEKKKLNDNEFNDLFLSIKKKDIDGINVTVPFKKKVIPYLDKLTSEAQNTQSVNTVYLEGNDLIGHNTDVVGFKEGIEGINYDVTNKKVLILGAGGVVSSIIFALNKMNVSNILVSNRTKNKAESLKNKFKKIEIIEWGDLPNFDIIINATSIGLKKDDLLNLDFSKIGKNKLFFDVIYNPSKTNFLKSGEKLGNQIENGKMMFIHQALAAFKIWHNVQPEVNNHVIKLLDQ